MSNTVVAQRGARSYLVDCGKGIGVVVRFGPDGTLVTPPGPLNSIWAHGYWHQATGDTSKVLAALQAQVTVNEPERIRFYSQDEERDERGRWSGGGGVGSDVLAKAHDAWAAKRASGELPPQPKAEPAPVAPVPVARVETQSTEVATAQHPGNALRPLGDSILAHHIEDVIGESQGWQNMSATGGGNSMFSTSDDINHWLREGDSYEQSEEQVVEDIKNIDAMIETHVLPVDTTMYRGVSGETLDVSTLQVGSIITDKGYSSFTPDEASAYRQYPMNIEEDPTVNPYMPPDMQVYAKGPRESDPVIALDAKAGQHCIGVDGEEDTPPIGSYSAEEGKDAWEILMPHGSSFRVTSIEPGSQESKGRATIHVEMVQ